MNDKNQTTNKTNKEEQEWEYQKDLDRREFYNYSAYDKAILTLSSAFFAFSLTIVKDFGSQHLCVIGISWLFFAMAIIGSLVSFYVANKAISHCRDNDNEKCNQWRKHTERLNIALGVVFSIGIFFVIIFAYLNLFS